MQYIFNAWRVQSSFLITDCNIDLVFVVDSSYLLGSSYWSNAINFIVNIVNAMTVGSSNAQIGLITLGFNPTVVFRLNTYTTKSSIISAIQAVTYGPQWTNIASGLNILTTDLFTAVQGDRSNFPDVAVIILGVPANQGQSFTFTSAQAVWAANISIFTIGTHQALTSEVQGISSSPQIVDKTYYLISDSTQLLTLESTLFTNMCPAVDKSKCKGTYFKIYKMFTDTKYTCT